MKIWLIFFLPFFTIPVFAESTDITVNVEELSGIGDVVYESNQINSLLIIISIIIASVAVFSTILTAYFLRRQVKTMEIELESKSEPLLVIEDLMPSQVFLQNGDIQSYAKWMNSNNHRYSDLDKVTMKFVIKNIGQGIAKDVVHAKHIDENEFSQEIFQNMGETKTNTVLSFNQKIQIIFEIDAEQWIKLGQKNIFAGLSIAYMGLKNKKYVGTIYGIDTSLSYIIDSW